MNYQMFLETLQQEVKRQIDAGGIVRINHMIKNNNTKKDSITILYAGENVSPAIHLDYFYEQYQQKVSMEEIVKQLLECYKRAKKTGRFDPDFYLNFEAIRKKIFCRIINFEKNQESLEKMPHRRFLDLAVVYYCEVEDDMFGKGMVLIQKDHLQVWEIEEEELHALAVENTFYDIPYELKEVSELVQEISGSELEILPETYVPMYVLTNIRKYFGAVNLYFPEILEKIAEKLQADFYVLPSSIHECMIVPVVEENHMRGADYQEMVEEINANFVDCEEVLSDSVYRYYRSRQELCIVARA